MLPLASPEAEGWGRSLAQVCAEGGSVLVAF